MEANAIALIQNTAVEAQKANLLKTHTPSIVLRNDDGQQQVVSLEPFAAHRSRFRGTYSTASLHDFAQYTIERPGGEGFILPDKLSATIIFNLRVNDIGTPIHDRSEPSHAGHGDHRAVLGLKASPAYAAMCDATADEDRRNGIKQRQFEQKPLIEWLEDWWDYLAADYPDAETGSGSDPLRMRQALNALRKVKVKATGESVHTDKDFGSSRSAMEDVEASSEVGLPRGFRFTCKPSDDLDERVFYLRLGVLTGEEKPKFVLRWSKREADVEAIGQNFKAKLLDAIGDKATMLLGTFDPGK